MVALFAIVWFGNLDYRKLVRPDEGRYAEIPREMATSGNWVTPRLNGIKYFEKPPMQYWATATAYNVFGEHEWTARIWPALTGFLGVLLIGWVGKRLFGIAAGLIAATILAASPGYVLIGHIATLDMGLTLFMTGTLCGLLMGLREDADEGSSRRWMHVAWASMALAVLSKGLIGMVLPLMVMAAYMITTRQWGVWRRSYPWSGLTVFFVICAPWFVSVSIANPEFPHFFFIHEHFARYASAGHNRPGSWWYFAPILAVGMLPFLPPILRAAVGVRWPRTQTFSPVWLLTLWSVLIFGFFSASSSKLPSYILPIFPALALLAVSRVTGQALRWPTCMLFALAGAGTVYLGTITTRFAGDPAQQPLYAAFAPWIIAAGVIALAGAAVAWYLSRKGSLTAGWLAAGFAALISVQSVMMGHDELNRASSAWQLTQDIRAEITPDIPFYSVGTYEQTLPFYIKRTVTLVAFRDEMHFGLTKEPARWVASIDEFRALWTSGPRALAIMNPDQYENLRQSGLPMEEVARDFRRVVVRTTARATP